MESYRELNLDDADLPFAEGAFDYTIMSHLIEHVKDWKAPLEKCNAVLKWDGLNNYSLLISCFKNYKMPEKIRKHLLIQDF